MFHGPGHDRDLDSRPELAQDSYGLTPLMFAAQAGQAPVVEFLLLVGACIHAKDEDGMAALHFAAEACCGQSCRALLRARADPENKDHIGRNAAACLPETLSQSELHEW